MAATFDRKPALSPYGDDPLGPREIRLLTIEATSEPSAISLIAQRHALDDELDYDAVSYVWGTAAASLTVQCNGAPLLVTPTVWDMLVELQHYNRPLWIDALCINQQDPDEKATQIPLMRHIYARADHVVVWLGPSNQSIDAFMTRFPDLSKLAKNWRERDKFIAYAGWPKNNDMLWLGLYHILNNEWFRRLWTYQEIVLAKKAVIICGLNWINAMSLFTFVRNGYYSKDGYLPYDATFAQRLSRQPPESQLAFRACDVITRARTSMRISGSTIRHGDLATVLYDLRKRQVKEPVDRIWSIAALLHEDIQEQLSSLVDYSFKGRTEYWTTYVAFARAVVNVGQRLHLLRYMTSSEPNPQLPSWCPDFSKEAAPIDRIRNDWNRPIAQISPAIAQLLSADDDDASSRLRNNIIKRHAKKHVWVDGHGALHVRGYAVDRISEVVDHSEPIEQDNIHNYDGSWSWYNDKAKDGAAVDLYATRLHLAQRVFCGPQNDGSAIPPEYLMAFYVDCRISTDFERAYRDTWTCLTGKGHGYIDSLDADRIDPVLMCLSQFRAMAGYSFFATEGGRFGIATPGCKIGDEVCAFYGGDCLHVLREDGASTKFCCVAFVPHLMEQHQRDAARIGEDRMYVIS